MELSNKILSEITVHMKYARYLPEHKRRETWDELVTRNMNMHLKKFPEMELQIRKAYKLVYDKKVLPSDYLQMTALSTGLFALSWTRIYSKKTYIISNNGLLSGACASTQGNVRLCT